MKKKILFLPIIMFAAALVTWVVVANKFEQTVKESYLLKLLEYKEKGWFDLDVNNVKIEKYKFKVVVDNFSYKWLGFERTHADQLSIYYNPFTDNVTIYTTGQKISIGTGESETYIANPNIIIKLNRSLLGGEFDKVKIDFLMKKHELLSARDNAVLTSEDDSEVFFTGDYDKGTNQYTIKIKGNNKGITLKREYFTFLNKRIKSELNNVLAPENKEKLIKIISALSNYYNNTSSLVEPVNNQAHILLNFDKKYFESFVRVLTHEIKPEKWLEDFKINEHPFGITVDLGVAYTPGNSRILAEITGDTKVLKGKLDFWDKDNFSMEQKAKLGNFISEFLANIFNIIKSSSKVIVTAQDFNMLANYISDINKTNLVLNTSYELANSNFDANLIGVLNNYKIDIKAQGGWDKEFTGSLKLSDPIALIAAKTKFTKEVLIPLFEKTGFKDKKDLVRLEKTNMNIAANGFEALKALSADSNLKAGDDFLANISFDPKTFIFKFNDKPFLKIITDDRIVKFLKGMEEAQEAKEAVQKQEIKEIIEQTEDEAL